MLAINLALVKLKRKKPDVSHLRVFGCDAYVSLSNYERSKVDPKVKKLMFFGYDEETKGYRLYDYERNKVILAEMYIFMKRGKTIYWNHLRSNIQKLNRLFFKMT